MLTPPRSPSLAPKELYPARSRIRDAVHHYGAIQEAIAHFARRLREEGTTVAGREVAGVRALPVVVSELDAD